MQNVNRKFENLKTHKNGFPPDFFVEEDEQKGGGSFIGTF